MGLMYQNFIMTLQRAIIIQWNLVIKRSGITKPSYNKVILLVPALYISLCFYPDIMRNLLYQGNFHGPKVLVIMRLHCNTGN